MSRLPTKVMVFCLLGALVSLAAGCGGGSTIRTPTRATALESIFEAPAQLLSAPATTLDELRRLGVDRVRVVIAWASVAPDPTSPTAPGGFDPASPSAYPAAGWSPLDALVRAAASRGVGVYLDPSAPAPKWATGSGEPARGLAGVWRPSPTAFGQFVHALGVRYSGGYTPSGESTPLPRVSFWSIWNEPNYGVNLAPQAIDDSTVDVAPALYRALLDAAWSALAQTGHGDDTILFGELAPRGITTGNNPGNFSGMVPLRFLRALYCVDSSFRQLRGAAATDRDCPPNAAGSAAFASAHPALFKTTGFAIHPYPQVDAAPDVPDPAFEPDFADLASLPRLVATLDRLQAAYASSTRFPIYSTEFGYITNPPVTTLGEVDPRTAAAYLNWAEYISWRDPRIRSWDQYLLTDPPAAANSQFASGLEFTDGTAKPYVFDAYRVPIFLPVTTTARGSSLEVWGCVRPARYARIDGGGATQVADVQFAGPGGTFHSIRRVMLSDQDGYFDVQVAFPSNGQVRIAWSYPHGATVYSRAVSLTVR